MYVNVYAIFLHGREADVSKLGTVHVGHERPKINYAAVVY
jgi:hypothetical protein